MQTTDQPSADALIARLLAARAQFLGYIRKRLANADEAEDLLQESLLKALRAAPALRDPDRLVPWFYRLLEHAIIDAYRRRRGEQRSRAGSGVPASALEPEEIAVLCECFRALLPALKPEYALLIEALDLGDERPAVVARRLGITRNNLKVRHHRARRALRRRLAEACRTCATHHCLDCTCRRS